MILDLVNKLMKPIMIIAIISIVITWAFNVENVLITDVTYNGIQMKTLDFRLYLENVNSAWITNALNFQDILIDREWVEIEGNITKSQFWEDLGNNLAFLFDCLYFPINLILWINRWISWLIRIVLALIGWNVGTRADGSYYSTLVQILDWIIENFKIPYI